MDKVICVYSSSSCIVDKIYFDTAAALGKAIAKNSDIMLFGAGMIGLMGECARAVHEEKGRVIGVIPEALNVKGVVYEKCDELYVTEGMRKRKEIMDYKSDAFITLPGGFGTLEELLEIITLKQLKYHNKAVVILNINGFYDGLINMFNSIIEKGFAKKENSKLYYVTENIEEALCYIESYMPHKFESKWMTDVE